MSQWSIVSFIHLPPMLFTVTLMSSHSVFRNCVGLTITKSSVEVNLSTLRCSLVNSSSNPQVSMFISGFAPKVLIPVPILLSVEVRPEFGENAGVAIVTVFVVIAVVLSFSVWGVVCVGVIDWISVRGVFSWVSSGVGVPSVVSSNRSLLITADTCFVKASYFMSINSISRGRLYWVSLFWRAHVSCSGVNFIILCFISVTCCLCQ